MLTYSYSQLKRDSENNLVEVDNDIDLNPEFFERSKNLLNNVKNLHVSGQFFYQEPFVTGNFTVEGDVEVPSTRSLEPVILHQIFNFTENYSETNPTQEQLEDEETIINVHDDEINLQKAIEDNLLLSLPSVILTESEKNGDYPTGKGWNIISESDYEKQKKDNKEVNSEFAKLKDLFNN